MGIRSLSICAVGGAGLLWACCRRGKPGALSHSVSSHGGRVHRGRAVVYADKGAGQRSVSTLVATLREHGLTVRTILADEVVAGGWEHGCDLFAMPGGADQPYCALLNGQGNARIRSFVAGGGRFIGICAGAYYGSARCEFELGTELEIAGARELAFFPGIARGAAFPGFVYAKETGSRAAELLLPCLENERAASPTFRDAPALPQTCTVSLRNMAGIVCCLIQASMFTSACTCLQVYVNGGCGFLAADGSSADNVPGCDVLAWFADPEVAERIGQSGSPTREYLMSKEQCATQLCFGPSWRSSYACSCAGRGCGQVACAVRCAFGDGVAILTGAHPELSASALNMEGHGSDNGLDPLVLDQLWEGETARRNLFEKLLVELRL